MLIVSVFGAAELGQWYGRRVAMAKKDEYRKSIRASVLSDLRGLTRGLPVPHTPLVELETQEVVSLSRLMNGQSAALFIDPRCESCISAVLAFDSAYTPRSAVNIGTRFIIIGDSTGSDGFQALVRATGSHVRMYLDIDQVLSRQFGLIVFPTLLTTDSAGLLLDVSPSGYTREEYEDALSLP